MRNKAMLGSLVLVAALAIAVPVFAKPMSTTLPVTHPVHFGQTEVQSGEYRLLIDGNHMTVLKGKATVAESEGRWEDRDEKSQYTAIVSNGEGRVIELRFAGKKSVFVLPR
jgi:hypothetical protein